MTRPHDNPGFDLEKLVHELASKMFLRDFVCPNPMFSKSGGRDKEAADLVVPFGDVLLGFQVKHRQLPPVVKVENEMQRVERIAGEAVGQLNTLRNAVSQSRIKELKTLRGITLSMQDMAFPTLIGVVVMDIVGNERLSAEDRIGLYNRFVVMEGVPVHNFLKEDFIGIASELDTMPDFLRYLQMRQDLYDGRRIDPLHEELDFLAYFKTRGDDLEAVRRGEVSMLSLSEGILAEYLKSNAEEIATRDAANQPSYLVDSVISFLHTAIAQGAVVENPAGLSPSLPPGSVASYFASITALSKLNRLERRGVGEKLALCLGRAAQRTPPHSHSLMMLPDSKTAVITLASGAQRAKRSQMLYTLSATAYCAFDVKTMIAIATEPGGAVERSFDVIAFEDVEFDNSDLFAKEASKFLTKGT